MIGPDRSGRRRSAAVALALAWLALVPLGVSGVASGTASAGAIATAGTTLGVTVTTWRAAPAPPAAPHPGTPLALTWTTSSGQGVATFDVVNVGDLPLAGQTINVRTDGAGGGSGDAPDPIVLTACVGGVWDSAGTSCPGTSVTLGSHRDGPLATGVALAPDGRLSVRATTARRTAAQTDVEVDVLVSRSDVAAPVPSVPSEDG